MPVADKELRPFEISLTGGLVTSVDQSQLKPGQFAVLKNLRPTATGKKGIGGMSKINSTAITTYVRLKNLFHFRKDAKKITGATAESHVLAHVTDASDVNPRILQNTTAIPTAGNFSGTAVFTASTGAGIGRFSPGPFETVFYANGVDTCVWGGDEAPVAAFILCDAFGTQKADYTEYVNNTIDDANNVATMTTFSDLDSNTKALWHFNADYTDSSGNSHTLTASGSVIDTNTKYFGAGSAYFDGSNDYASIADHADFDLSGGIWTINMWVRSLGQLADDVVHTLYYHGTDANNYFQIYIQNQILHVKLVLAGVQEFDNVSTPYLVGNPSTPVWAHIEVAENGDNYYLFVDGFLVYNWTDTARLLNFTGSIYIGSNSTPGTYYYGYIDELEVYVHATSPRHTATFTPNSYAYGTSNCYLHLLTIRPIQGVKLYISTANSNAAVPLGYYWATGIFNSMTLTDGTASAGATLAATGSITFTSTVTTAKPRYYNGFYGYLYQFVFPGISAGTKVYHCTIDAPMQQAVDLWDAVPRIIATCQYFGSSAYVDATVNVFSSNYDSTVPTTYLNMATFTTTDYLYIGFSERVAGLIFKLITGNLNNNVTNLTLAYWSGSSWTQVTGLTDLTRSASAPWAQDGTIFWDPPSEISEMKTAVNGVGMWYFYRIGTNANLDTNIRIDSIFGIPAPKTIGKYRFPTQWQERVLLCGNQYRDRNSILVGGAGSPAIFNGTDTTEIFLGDNTDILAAESLFVRTASALQANLVVCKATETYVLDSDGTIAGIRQYKVSSTYGISAPLSMVACDLGYEIAPGINRHVLMWQTNDGFVMFDNGSIRKPPGNLPDGSDIDDLFDPLHSNYIGAAVLPNSFAWFEPNEREYCVAILTSTPKEFHYSLVYQQWFEVVRHGTAARLFRCACVVTDTNNNRYVYGGDYTGFMMRTENGQHNGDASSNSMTYQMRTGGLRFLDSWLYETEIRNLKLVQKSKNTTANTVTLAHYADGASAASTFPSNTMDPTDANHSIAQTVKPVLLRAINHQLDFSLTTNDENNGFEPVALGGFYKVIREDIK